MKNKKAGRQIRPEIGNASQGNEWGAVACGLIKQSLVDKGWGYADLAKALEEMEDGATLSPAVLNRRVNRGNFSAGFLLMCLQALGASGIELNGTGGATTVMRALNPERQVKKRGQKDAGGIWQAYLGGKKGAR